MPSAKRNWFADTNLLVYAADPTEVVKRRIARDWMTTIVGANRLVLSPQSLNECYRVLTERRRMTSRDRVRRYIQALSSFCTAPAGVDVIRRAWHIQDIGEFGWWDCLILSSALLAECDVFLSEDMQHERTIDGMTILNPFKLGQPADHIF